jgi:HNH endonuclease
MASQLLESYVIKDRASELANWFIAFESYRREQEKLPGDEADNEMVIYHEKTSHSTDALDSLSWRHEFLLRKFFEAVPDVELKDDQRLFTHEQRLAIYRRDAGICKVVLKCQGQKCEWDNWAADHINPWSNGGKTTVENGQVTCVACNSAKRDSVHTLAVSV